MALTHHPVRLFRLSCGCLRAYPMMPAGTEHTVLCVRCRAEAVTVLAYPERICGALGWAVVAGLQTRVACTFPGRACTARYTGTHFDAVVNETFSIANRGLEHRSREGKTGRA